LGKSLPPQDAAIDAPQKTLAFSGVAQVDVLQPAFAGKGHGWLFHRQKAFLARSLSGC
jgi:hypothetical protein